LNDGNKLKSRSPICLFEAVSFLLSFHPGTIRYWWSLGHFC